MSETNHTPTPWVLSEKRIGFKGRTKQGYVGETVATTSPKDDDETRRANAEFIVRACNSHDELLAACEWLVFEFTESIATMQSDNESDFAGIRKARAAIDKAKGGAI